MRTNSATTISATVNSATVSTDRVGSAGLVDRLRAAGCVYAEDEAAILVDAATDHEQLQRFTHRRMAGEALESIVGWVGFGALRLAVRPGVFVPRQRSLFLARLATERAQRHRHPIVLEAYAGVAPIAATILSAHPQCEVHISDIDATALACAQRNVPAVAGVHCGDGFAALPSSLRNRITLLVAVPPYVPVGAAGLLPREAREREPAAALFAGLDGLDHVRSLIGAVAAWTTADGRALIEQSKTQYEPSAELAHEAGLVPRRHASADGQTIVLELGRRKGTPDGKG